MSLLLNGAKTATIAGTQMQCIEIYAGESYTLPFSFTDTLGASVDCTGWTLDTTAKWYKCGVSYPAGNAIVEEIILSNITVVAPQPTVPPALTSAFVTPATGIGYIYLPTTLSGTTAETTPDLTDTTTLLCIVSMSVTRVDTTSGFNDTNREPIGILIRYQ
jgi:hypothetical protein